jgi:hypothetical protein
MSVSVAAETEKSKAWNFNSLPNITEWVRQGMDRFLASQKILLDLVASQNTIATNALREQLDTVAASPGATLSDFARDGVRNYIEAQRVLLDLVQRQNDIVLGGMKRTVGGYAPISAVTELLRRSVSALVESQQNFLAAAEKQTNAWLDSAKAGDVFGDREARQLVRDGIDNFERAQRKILDAISDATSWEEEKPSEGGENEARPDFAGIARDSADAFLQAQKRIIELAGQQMTASLKATRETIDMVEPPSQASMESMSRESVEKFVAAQKAQLDLLAKTLDTEAGQAK